MLNFLCFELTLGLFAQIRPWSQCLMLCKVQKKYLYRGKLNEKKNHVRGIIHPL